jgi:phospholipid/cholesterol/gamma-HCH transport system permease protein
MTAVVENPADGGAAADPPGGGSESIADRIRGATDELGSNLTETARSVGGMVAMFVDSMAVTARAIVRRRFPWWEFLIQMRFMAAVSLLPTVLIAIPFGLVLVLTVGGLTSQVGATSLVGAVTSVGTVREASPIISGIVLAGAGGSAICADLGSRAIRNEIAAMRVMAVDPLERLIAPRILATTLVSILINGVVAFVGIVSGYLSAVYILHASAGGFLNSFSAFAQTSDLVESMVKAMLFGVVAALVASYQGLNAKHGPAGVGEAVNRSVVVTGVLLFVLNLLVSQVFLLIAPPRVG